jgi:hypothetical protein
MKQAAQTLLRIVVSLAVSAFALGLILRLAEPPEGQGSVALLMEVLRRVVPSLLGAYLLLTLAQTALRAWRYRVLLRASGEPEVPGFGHILLVTLARNMFVDLLPARLGELSYVALLNRGYRVSGAACLSSLAISMVFDFVALLAVIAVLLAVSLARARPEPWMLGTLAALLAICAAGLVAVFAGIHWFTRAARRLRLGRIAERAVAFLERLAVAIDETRRRGVVSATLLLSLGVRAGKYAGFYCAFLAVTSQSFAAMAAASPGQVLAGLLAAESAAGIPVPSFMSFGSYEAGGMAAWKWLGFDAGEAALCMLAVHVCSQAIDYSLGAAGLVLLTFFGIRNGRAPSAVTARRGAPRAWAAAALVLAGGAAAFLAIEQRRIRKAGALSAPPAGRAVEEHRSAASEPEGFLVWSSNRSGNHDIWRMDLPGGSPVRVTTNPHVETYPRISPDGRRIVFARSKKPWVSQRDDLNWDVYLLELGTGKEQLVSRDACAPTWSDNDHVVFQLQGTQVVERALSSGEARVLCASGAGNIPAGTRLETPHFNPRDGRVAATLRGAARQAAVIDTRDNRAARVGGGCQLFWSPDGSFLYCVDHGGRMRNAFYKVDPASLQRTAWFDMQGAFSHEYFPQLSQDGCWLIFGAAADGHEHDTADYEIFLWKVGSPPESAMRLTWHTGNDCWPDVWIAPRAASFSRSALPDRLKAVHQRLPPAIGPSWCTGFSRSGGAPQRENDKALFRRRGPAALRLAGPGVGPRLDRPSRSTPCGSPLRERTERKNSGRASPTPRGARGPRRSWIRRCTSSARCRCAMRHRSGSSWTGSST